MTEVANSQTKPLIPNRFVTMSRQTKKLGALSFLDSAEQDLRDRGADLDNRAAEVWEVCGVTDIKAERQCAAIHDAKLMVKGSKDIKVTNELYEWMRHPWIRSLRDIETTLCREFEVASCSDELWAQVGIEDIQTAKWRGALLSVGFRMASHKVEQPGQQGYRYGFADKNREDLLYAGFSSALIDAFMVVAEREGVPYEPYGDAAHPAINAHFKAALAQMEEGVVEPELAQWIGALPDLRAAAA